MAVNFSQPFSRSNLRLTREEMEWGRVDTGQKRRSRTMRHCMYSKKYCGMSNCSRSLGSLLITKVGRLGHLGEGGKLVTPPLFSVLMVMAIDLQSSFLCSGVGRQLPIAIDPKVVPEIGSPSICH